MKIQSTNNMLETNKVDYRKNLKYKVNVLDFMYVILLYLLIFQDVLRTNISIFQYLDEILAVVGIMIGGITIIITSNSLPL